MKLGHRKARAQCALMMQVYRLYMGPLDEENTSYESRHTPANMDAGGQTPGSLSFWGRGLLQNLAGQAEGRSCELGGQKHHTLALEERQLQQIASHPHHLKAHTPLKLPYLEITSQSHDLEDVSIEVQGNNKKKKLGKEHAMLIYRWTAASNRAKKEEEMQRGTVGQIKLEPAENFALHSQQLMLSVGVVHQVAEPRHLEEAAQKIHSNM